MQKKIRLAAKGKTQDGWGFRGLRDHEFRGAIMLEEGVEVLYVLSQKRGASLGFYTSATTPQNRSPVRWTAVVRCPRRSPVCSGGGEVTCVYRRKSSRAVSWRLPRAPKADAFAGGLGASPRNSKVRSSGPKAFGFGRLGASVVGNPGTP